MQDDRLSQTEELTEILEEYRAKKRAMQVEAARKEKEQPKAAEPKTVVLPSPSAAETRVLDAKTRVEVSFEETVSKAEDSADPVIDLPDAVVQAHFADSVSEDEMGISGHFTESVGDEPPLPEEGEVDDDEDDDEDEEEEEDKSLNDEYAGLPRPVRITNRILNFLADLNFLPKAVLYVAAVLLCAAFLSYYVLTIGNDIFALVKGNAEIVIEIPEDATLDEVAALLEEEGLIEYDWVFSIYLGQSGDGEEIEFIPGKHTLNTSMNYSQLLSALTTSRRERVSVRVTIPEGYTTDSIIDLFVSKGIGTREGFVEAINQYPYKHEFVQLLEEQGWDERRVYRLEGYLYPDTYDFYTDTQEYLVINKLLNNFNSKMWRDWKKEYSALYEESGLTFDDIVTLSSLIQAEGKTAEDFEYISYVFHNRMDHPSTYPMLESDATIQYALELAGMDRIQDASQIDKSFPSPYNTYINEGLPPGAICNAGLDAMLAAIYPAPPLDDDGDVLDAYYFVSNDRGETYYAHSLSAHLKNVERVKRENEEMKAEENE